MIALALIAHALNSLGWSYLRLGISAKFTNSNFFKGCNYVVFTQMLIVSVLGSYTLDSVSQSSQTHHHRLACHCRPR